MPKPFAPLSRPLFASLLAGSLLAGCAGTPVLSRIYREQVYEPRQVTASIRDGVLPAAIVGTPFAGVDAAGLAASLSPPGWLEGTRIGAGAPRGYRLVLAFDPLVPVNPDSLCAAPETVETGPPQGKLRVQGAWCFHDRAASRAFLETEAPREPEDPAFRSAMRELLLALLPSTEWPADADTRSDLP